MRSLGRVLGVGEDDAVAVVGAPDGFADRLTTELAGQPVLSVSDLTGGTADLPSADVLRYTLPGSPTGGADQPRPIDHGWQGVRLSAAPAAR